jgi:SPP1 family predicted phage head-tail adaptor
MEAGKLDRRITIQTYLNTKNEFGEVEQAWTDVATVWAAVNETGGSEKEEAKQVQATDNTVFAIRFRWDVAEKDRIIYRNKPYNILSIKEIGRQKGLEIVTTHKESDKN